MNPGVVKPVAVARAVTVVEKRASATIVPMTNLELLALVPRHGRSSRRRSPEVPGSLVRDVRREHEDDEGPAPDSLAATGRRHSWRVREPRARRDSRSVDQRTERASFVRWSETETGVPSRWVERALRSRDVRHPSTGDIRSLCTRYVGAASATSTRAGHPAGTGESSSASRRRNLSWLGNAAKRSQQRQQEVETRTPPGLPLSSPRASLRGRLASS